MKIQRSQKKGLFFITDNNGDIISCDVEDLRNLSCLIEYELDIFPDSAKIQKKIDKMTSKLEESISNLEKERNSEIKNKQDNFDSVMEDIFRSVGLPGI